MKTNYFETLENPFLIDITEKQEYKLDDYIKIQEKLKEKNIDSFLDSLYPEHQMNTTLEEMKRRCKKGISGNIIDIKNPILPTIKVTKIGNGGDGKKCFVCWTTLIDDRFEASQTMVQSFEEVGFNGHFLLLNGGFPNPSGKEMKYAGVPYSFKIFMILEAAKLGFDQVIWVDAACYAVNNVEPLFDILKEHDSVFRAYPPNCFSPNTYNNICFPKTIELLNNLVNRDVRDDTTINTIVFGLNLLSPKIKQFIDVYYEYVKLGLPFLTSFPEEIVFSTIFNSPEYNYVFNNRCKTDRLFINDLYLDKQNAKNSGYYFVQRLYR